VNDEIRVELPPLVPREGPRGIFEGVMVTVSLDGVVLARQILAGDWIPGWSDVATGIPVVWGSVLTVGVRPVVTKDGDH